MHKLLFLFLLYLNTLSILQKYFYDDIVFWEDPMQLGKFVVIEGGDGTGKTTFVNALKENCPNFIFSREPGGKGMSQKIRELVLSDEAKTADPFTMFNLFWASRAENFAKVILPELSAGITVVSDRFDASTYAYQIGENPGLGNLFWTTRTACLRGVTPTYIFFDLSVEASKKRLQGRGDQNHFDLRGDGYRYHVRSMYLKFFHDERVRSVTLDADVPQDEMISRGMGALEQALIL